MRELTESMRRVLVALANMPTDPHGLAVVLEKSIHTARKSLVKARDAGYVSKTDNTYALTDFGKEMLVSGVVVGPRPKAIDMRCVKARLFKPSCEPWQPAPYNHNDFRPGSMDAFSLPSLFGEKRVSPWAIRHSESRPAGKFRTEQGSCTA